VALHQHAHVQTYTELLRQVVHALLLGLAAAIGEEEEGDALLLKVGERFMGAWKGIGGTDEDTINAVATVSIMSGTIRHM